MFSRYETFGAALNQDLNVDPETPITSDLEGQEVAKIMLARSHLKKREVWPDTMIAQQTKAALDLFLESNTACEGWSWRPVHVMDDLFAGELTSFLADLLDPQHEPESEFGLNSIKELMEPGPGAARGANADNFYTKLFASPLTATSEYLLSLYRAAIVDIPHWAEAEQYRFNVAKVSRLKGATKSLNDSFFVVPGSTWFSVPKSLEIRRACATEPNINMLMQKALGRWIELRLKRVVGIDLSDQQFLNQRLARDGSISGLYGTIDLKSASDRNSMAMIEKFCPPTFVKWVKLFRSPYCQLPSGSEVKMEMCSSMGNGFTFPLQTALFVGVVYCCYKLAGLPFFKNRSVKLPAQRREALFTFEIRKNPGNFGVFGDDIIVDRSVYDFVCRQLGLLGHVVNDQKSFNSGHFRESCGSDFFAGYNVRGIYIRSLETPLDVYSAINRLTDWSARHGVNLSSTLACLMGWVRFLPVPFSAADYEGIKVPYDATRPVRNKPPESVWADAQDWQCATYRGIAVRSSASKVPELSRDEEVEEPSNGLTGNLAGWLVAALGGYCRTPPYRLGEPVPPHNKGDSATLKQRRRPDVVIGKRPKPDEPLRWSVKWKTATHWVERPTLPGPVFGTDRGDAWECVAGRHEFLYLLTRV